MQTQLSPIKCPFFGTALNFESTNVDPPEGQGGSGGGASGTGTNPTPPPPDEEEEPQQ